MKRERLGKTSFRVPGWLAWLLFSLLIVFATLTANGSPFAPPEVEEPVVSGV